MSNPIETQYIAIYRKYKEMARELEEVFEKHQKEILEHGVKAGMPISKEVKREYGVGYE